MALRTYREAATKWEAAYEALKEDYIATLDTAVVQQKEAKRLLKASKERETGKLFMGGGIVIVVFTVFNNLFGK